MCVGATKGTFRKDIKTIVNHDYIKQCIIFAKNFLGVITLANLSIQLTSACIYTPQHINFRCFVCACCLFRIFRLTLYDPERAFNAFPLRNFALTHLIQELQYRSASLSINPASQAGVCTDCEYIECTIAIIIIVILVRSLFLVY